MMRGVLFHSCWLCWRDREKCERLMIGATERPNCTKVANVTNVTSLVAGVLIASLVLVGAAAFAQTAHYRTDGPAKLNDLKATPGAVRTMDTAQLCSKSFHTGTVRNVTESTKQSVCRAYGLAKTDCVGKKVEIDHLISLELGGSNDPTNLWPQPYAPRPGAKEKDVVENWLHAQVCAGNISLKDAQQEISTDWYKVYLKTQEKQ